MKLKTHTISKWCEIFGVSIIDNDGFRGLELNNNEVNLELFLDGINICTIAVVNKERYKVLNELN
jgi:hypothetical protein